MKVEKMVVPESPVSASEMDCTPASFADAWAEAEALTSELRREGIEFAVFGSVGAWRMAGGIRGWMESHRRPPRDIDATSSRRSRRRLRDFMTKAGYRLDEHLAFASEGAVYLFRKPKGCEVEVRFDELEFCHTIRLKGRLCEEAGTLPLSDLLLSKLAIVEVNETDAYDTVVLLHAASEQKAGQTSCWEATVCRICEVLGSDWGAWYTVSQSLARIPKWLSTIGDGLGSVASSKVASAAICLSEVIGGCRKSLRWRVRSTIGARLKWYRTVAEKKDVF